ncbi:hypothetical protein D3C78_1508360 [compost metagenome]
MRKQRLTGLTKAIVVIIAIVVFVIALFSLFLGLCLHGADQIIDGVEINNVRSEVLLTIFIYGFFFLIEKFAELLKERDAAAHTEHSE